MILSSGTIVLVADGARMVLMRNAGDAANPDLQAIEHRQYESLPARQLATDAPGVSFSSGSRNRHTYDEGDPHDDEETRFLRAAAEALDRVVSGDAEPVVVVAPPPTLGILRGAYSPKVKAAMKAEIDKDLTRLPVPEIADRLAAM